jgi:hypothetical protein
MKLLVAMSVFVWGSLAFANPEVTKDTDIGKRKVTEHYQVTRCEGGGDDCKINTVTKFNKSVKEKKIYFGECNYSEVDNMRVSECTTSPKKKKSKTKTKTVVKEKVVDTTKKNRIQLHIGAGPAGLKVDEDNNKTKVEEDRKAILGLQYTRKLNNRWNVGASVFTNKSATISIGLDY